MKVNVEYTDMFSGEANYSWVKRESFEIDDNASDLSIVRKAKKLFDLNGVRCKKSDLGDTVALTPSGSCTVLFISIDGV